MSSGKTTFPPPPLEQNHDTSDVDPNILCMDCPINSLMTMMIQSMTEMIWFLFFYFDFSLDAFDGLERSQQTNHYFT
jgi:hypothetical protein